MFYVLRMIRRIPKGEKAQALTEYALILALIVLVVIAALSLVGINLNLFFYNDLSSRLEDL